MAIAAGGAAALDRSVQRHGIWTRIGFLPEFGESDRQLPLVRRHNGVGDAVFRVPAEVGMQVGTKADARDVFGGARTDRSVGNFLVQRIAGRQDRAAVLVRPLGSAGGNGRASGGGTEGHCGDQEAQHRHGSYRRHSGHEAEHRAQTQIAALAVHLGSPMRRSSAWAPSPRAPWQTVAPRHPGAEATPASRKARSPWSGLGTSRSAPSAGCRPVASCAHFHRCALCCATPRSPSATWRERSRSAAPPSAADRRRRLLRLPGPAVDADELRALGFKIVNQANNHSLDYGASGRAQTSPRCDGPASRTPGFPARSRYLHVDGSGSPSSVSRPTHMTPTCSTSRPPGARQARRAQARRSSS